MTPEGWRKTCIGGVATVATGGTPRRDDPSLWGGGIPWMSSGEVHKRRVRSTDETISRRALEISNAKLLPANSVVLALNGQGRTRGMSAILEIPATCNQSLAAILPTSLLDPNFLLHSLESKYAAIRAITGDGGRNGLNLALVRSIELVLPPLPEQRKIATILSSVDDAIEASQAVIDQLQVVKKAMMAELLTKGLPGRHKRFKQTELGQVPVEWTVCAIDSLGMNAEATVRSGPFGSSMKTKDFVASGVPVLTIQSLGHGELLREGLFYVSNEKARELAEYKVRPNDVVFSRVADIGRCAAISEEEDGWLISPNLSRIRLDPGKADARFLMYLITAGASVLRQVEMVAGNAGRPVISSTTLKELRLPVPELPEQHAIAAAGQELENRLTAERQYLIQLQDTNSALMSVLLTGEVRVRVDEEAAA